MKGNGKVWLLVVLAIVRPYHDDNIFIHFLIVVTQQYVTETHNVYVIVGNSALFKCELQSFVADFVTIDSWKDNNGNEYFSDSSNNYGKCLSKIINMLLIKTITFHHKGSISYTQVKD